MVIFLALINPFNIAISNNSTDEGNVVILTYPKTVKKYQIGISKETISNDTFDFGSFFGSLFSGITKKFSGLLGGLFANFSGGGATTSAPDLDFGNEDDEFGLSTDDTPANDESEGDEDFEISQISGESDSDTNNDFGGDTNSFVENDNYDGSLDVRGPQGNSNSYKPIVPIKTYTKKVQQQQQHQYQYSTKVTVESGYLPPKPTPSYSYELPYIYWELDIYF